MMSQMEEVIAAEAPSIRGRRAAWSMRHGAHELALRRPTPCAPCCTSAWHATRPMSPSPWPPSSGPTADQVDGPPSAVWVSAFTAPMVARANRVLHEARLTRALRRATP